MKRPYQRPAPGPREVRAPHQPREGGGEADAAGSRAHTHTKDTRGIPERQPDRARGTHRPRGMAYQPAKGHPYRTARHTRRGTRGAGGGKWGRHDTRYRPEPPQPAASAAHTRPGHCTRQGSSCPLRQAPTPKLGSHRASPRRSQWRQAGSTDPAAPAPRATTH